MHFWTLVIKESHPLHLSCSECVSAKGLCSMCESVTFFQHCRGGTAAQTDQQSTCKQKLWKRCRCKWKTWGFGKTQIWNKYVSTSFEKVTQKWKVWFHIPTTSALMKCQWRWYKCGQRNQCTAKQTGRSDCGPTYSTRYRNELVCMFSDFVVWMPLKLCIYYVFQAASSQIQLFVNTQNKNFQRSTWAEKCKLLHIYAKPAQMILINLLGYTCCLDCTWLTVASLSF